MDTYDTATNQCVYEVIGCDDENSYTVDVCFPGGEYGNCQHYSIFDDVVIDTLLEDDQFEDAYIFEDEPDLTDTDITRIVEWLKSEVTQVRTPFCWRQTYGRGVGDVLKACPSGKQKIGLLCYTPCRSGYSRQGTLDCQQKCKSGWRDDGLFCRKPEYGRGAGYGYFPFRDHPRDRCEDDHGRGNCERYGLIWYPKCRSGYSNSGCCICRPSFSSCTAEGYTNPRIDLSCAVKIELGDPTPLICAGGLEQDGLLCYPPCRDNFNGIGPVCWQECDDDQVNCGLGKLKAELVPEQTCC